MSQKSCCIPECPITAEDAEIYKQEDTITDNDDTNINISMNRKNADCFNSTHNYLNDKYSELTIDKTYDDDQKVYIEIETEMDLSHFKDDKNCIKQVKENSDVVELVQQVSENYVTHESSVGNNVKIKNVDPEVYIKRSKKSEEVINESLKITNEDLQIKIEIDEDKEKIVENEEAVRVDLSIVKQELDNGFHMQIKEEQNKVHDLEIKKEVEDCDEVFKGIFEVSKLESDFEADDDTNIGACITETETRVEPKLKDDVDSNVFNRNLRTIARVNMFRMEKKKKCHRFHSMMEKNTDDSHEERKRKRQINDSSDDGKVEEERNRKNREKCKRYREKKKNEVAALPISGSYDFDEKKREEERKQKIREKVRRYREKKKNEVAAVFISGPFDSDEKKREEERKQKNREKVRRYREKKKNELAAVFISGPFDSDEKKREEERKQKNREKVRRYREKKKNEVTAVSISGLFDSDEKKREEERKQKNSEKCAIHKQEDTITDNDETNINISMNGTHNYLNDEYSELTIDKTYDDQKVYNIEIETEMDLSHKDDKNCIKLEKENSDVVELVQQVSEDYCTREISVGNNVKINNVDPKVFIKRSKKDEEVNIFRKASGDTYNCTKCLCIFESFYRYVSHFFLHDIKPNACPLCETSYESVKPLCNHIRNFHIAKSFVSLKVLSHEFETKDKMKTYKCLVCKDIVIKRHCFNHWEKHFRFKASKQRLGFKFLDLADVDRKLENTLSAKVMEKFKGMNDTEKDAMIIDKGTEESVPSTCVNSDLQNNIETNVDNKKISNAETFDLTQGENEDTNEEEIEGNQHNSNGGDALRRVDYEMKCCDSGEDTDTVVVVREELRPGLHLNKDLYRNVCIKGLVKAKEYYCTKCGVMFWSFHKYMEHLDQKHVRPPNACPKCTQICINFKNVYEHVRRHIVNSFQRLNKDTEVMGEEISKMVKCVECNLIVEKSNGFAHWEEHLCVDVSTIAGDKEMSNKETT